MLISKMMSLPPTELLFQDNIWKLANPWNNSVRKHAFLKQLFLKLFCSYDDLWKKIVRPLGCFCCFCREVVFTKRLFTWSTEKYNWTMWSLHIISGKILWSQRRLFVMFNPYHMYLQQLQEKYTTKKMF